MYLNDDQEELIDAVADDNARKVNALLKKGVHPDFNDESDDTPLGRAIENGNFNMVKALVEAGADVNRPSGNYDKEKPLDIADKKSRWSGGYDDYYDPYDSYGSYNSKPRANTNARKIVEYLESQGAVSDEKDRLTLKQQDLVEAVESGDTRKVKALLAKGVDPDFADGSGDTPLDLAIDDGKLAIVKALVEGGSDINRVNKYKEAPLDRAKNNDDDAIAQYLESEGAVTGKTAKRKGAAPKTKKARGSGVGLQEDFGPELYDDDKYYFGADEGAGAKKKSARVPAVKGGGVTQSLGAPQQPKTPPRPVFREDTLADIFNAKKWVGKTDEMIELWDQVPKRLQKEFDFAASLAAARQGTLKQNAPRITLQNCPRLNAQNQQDAPAQPPANNDAPPPAAPKPEGPKP